MGAPARRNSWNGKCHESKRDLVSRQTGDAAEPEINTEKSRPAGDFVEPVEPEKPEIVSEKSRTDIEHGSRQNVSKLPDHKPS